jgi:DNA repair protein RadC
MRQRYSDCLEPGWTVYLREPAMTSERAAAAKPIATSIDIAMLLGPRIVQEVVEVMYVVGMNNANMVVCMTEVARGALGSCSTDIATIFRTPIVTGCTAIILAHNHPSGDETPSPEDRHMTAKVADAGKLLGIQLLDHVVLGSTGRFASFRDLGLLK